MMFTRSYRIAFVVAILLHLSIVIFLMSERSSERPVLTVEAKNEAGQMQPQPLQPPQAQPIQAVSVDSQEVMKTVNRLKAERAHQQHAEESRQRVLNQQAELARKQRIEEQQQLQQLKKEAAAMAVARQKQLVEEQEHLKQLAKQKAEQEKHLADMKQEQLKLQKQQEQESKKLAELTKKKADELALANQLQAEKAKAELTKKKADELALANQLKAEKAKAELAQKQRAAAQQAVVDAANAARISGEVNKYKALILSAISQQWILPQNADSTMSSQFRIRLAPNGSVLEVALIRSSGDAILDRSAQSAIYKASPLPVPSDPTTFNLFRDISLTVRPGNARG